MLVLHCLESFSGLNGAREMFGEWWMMRTRRTEHDDMMTGSRMHQSVVSTKAERNLPGMQVDMKCMGPNEGSLLRFSVQVLHRSCRGSNKLSNGGRIKSMVSGSKDTTVSSSLPATRTLYRAAYRSRPPSSTSICINPRTKVDHLWLFLFLHSKVILGMFPINS